MPTDTKTTPTCVYVRPEGVSHTQALRTLLQAGFAPSVVKEAYVTARDTKGDYQAKEGYQNAERKGLLGTDKRKGAPGGGRRYLGKHADQHLALALGQLNPISLDEQIARDRKAIAAHEEAAIKAKARLAAATTAKAKATA